MKNKLVTAAAFKTGPHHGTYHYHNGYELIFVKRGQLAVSIGEESYQATDGTLILVGNLENHTLRVDSTVYERYFVNLATKECEKALDALDLIALLKFRPEGFRHTVCFDAETAARVAHLFSRIISECERADAYSETLTGQYVKEIMIEVKRSLPDDQGTDGGIRAQLYEMQSYLDRHFAEDIRIDELCGRFYANRYYLTHAFKLYTGYSPKQYLTLVRLHQAVELFAEQGVSVSTAAEECGFSSLTCFIRSFKKHYGTTPSEYKEKNKL